MSTDAIIEHEWTTGAGLRAVALIICFENIKTGESYKNHRCGYVEAPPSLGGIGYDDINVQVHGGCTYADAGKPGVEGYDKEGWWFGFDCAHAGDGDIETPPWRAETRRHEAKTLDFVRAECESLAAQLVALAALTPKEPT